jgi:hypothetical protein
VDKHKERQTRTRILFNPLPPLDLPVKGATTVFKTLGTSFYSQQFAAERSGSRLVRSKQTS